MFVKGWLSDVWQDATAPENEFNNNLFCQLHVFFSEMVQSFSLFHVHSQKYKIYKNLCISYSFLHLSSVLLEKYWVSFAPHLDCNVVKVFLWLVIVPFIDIHFLRVSFYSKQSIDFCWNYGLQIFLGSWILTRSLQLLIWN